MKYEYGWLINMAITLIGGIICYVLTKEIILGVLIAVCVFLGLGVIILLLLLKGHNNGLSKEREITTEKGREQPTDEIKTKLELVDKIEKLGIKECDLSIENGITTEKGLEDVKECFCAMVIAGTKFLGADNFNYVVRRCGVRKSENIRFLLANPDSEELRTRSKERGMSEDTIGNLIRNNLKTFKHNYKDLLHVKFYPKWYGETYKFYTPWIRLFFVDDRYVLIAFYKYGETGNKSPQLKIIKNGNIERSFYTPFKEIFEMLWDQGEEVDWDKY